MYIYVSCVYLYKSIQLRSILYFGGAGCRGLVMSQEKSNQAVYLSI
jgi:hypothetical protein